MLILIIFITGLVVGLASAIFKTSRSAGKVINNIIFGFFGALVGAFVGFGDSLFLLKYNFLNIYTLAIIGSVVFVLIVILIQRAKSEKS